MARAATAERLAPIDDEPAAAAFRPSLNALERDRKVYDWSAIRTVLVEQPVKAIAPEPEMLFCFAD